MSWGSALVSLALALSQALAMMAFVLAWRLGGLLSFATAVPMAVGALATAHAVRGWEVLGGGVPVALAPLAGVLAGAAVGGLAATLLAARTSMAFAMLTLALGECVHAAAPLWPRIFGGDAGIGIDRLAADGTALALRGDRAVLAMAAVHAACGAALVARALRSTAALRVAALRDDPQRLASLGFEPRRWRAGLLVVAAALAGWGGGVDVLVLEHVHADAMAAGASIEFVVYGVLGTLVVERVRAIVRRRSRTASGPDRGTAATRLAIVASGFVGTLMWWAARHGLAPWTPAWVLIVGVVFVAAVAVSREALDGARAGAVPAGLAFGADGRDGFHDGGATTAWRASGPDVADPPAAGLAGGVPIGVAGTAGPADPVGMAASTAAAPPGAAAASLRLHDLQVAWNDAAVLRGASLGVAAGECVALTGPNGAGKSTLLAIASGDVDPQRGTVRLGTAALDRLSPARRRRLGLARGFQSSSLFRGLTVGEHLRVAGARLDDPGTWQVLAALDLAAWQDAPVDALGHARARLLDLALALAPVRRWPVLVLLLDEPTAGLDAAQAAQWIARVRPLLAGRTVLLVEHDARVVAALATRRVVLRDGRVEPGERCGAASPAHGPSDRELMRHGPHGGARPHAVHANRGEGTVDRAAPPAATDRTASRATARAAIADAGAGTLRVHDLGVRIDGRGILRGIDLHAGPGEVLQIDGEDGSGRSTLLRAIAGLVPARGRIVWNGAAIDGRPAWVIALAGVAHLPQGREVFGPLTVEQNLRLALSPAGTLDDVWDAVPELRTRRAVRAQVLSGGEQQLLALGRVVAAAPRLVLLDEPGEGLAAPVRERVARLVGRWCAHGCTVLLVDGRGAIPLGDDVVRRRVLLRAGRLVAADDDGVDAGPVAGVRTSGRAAVPAPADNASSP